MEWPDIRCEKDLDSEGSEFIRFSIPISPAVLTMRGILLPVPPRARASEWSDEYDQPELRLCVSIEATEYGVVDQFAGVFDPQRGWIMLRPVSHPTGKKLTNTFFQLVGEEAARIRRRFEEVTEIIQDNLAELRRQRVLGVLPNTAEFPIEPAPPPNPKDYSPPVDLEIQGANPVDQPSISEPRPKTKSKKQPVTNRSQAESPLQPKPLTGEAVPETPLSTLPQTPPPVPAKTATQEKKKPKAKGPASGNQMSLFDL
ncbi:MAG: hypothetical protein HY774_16105 [Acidobacteria bacterium]|nr:hypothetical protein [Acidobacteriota bacterium]